MDEQAIWELHGRLEEMCKEVLALRAHTSTLETQLATAENVNRLLHRRIRDAMDALGEGLLE